MSIKDYDGTIVITGESVRPMAELSRLHGWRRAATMKVKHGMTDKHYASVKDFNAEYGVNARTWAQVLEVTTDVIKELGEELKAAKSAREGNGAQEA